MQRKTKLLKTRNSIFEGVDARTKEQLSLQPFNYRGQGEGVVEKRVSYKQAWREKTSCMKLKLLHLHQKRSQKIDHSGEEAWKKLLPETNHQSQPQLLQNQCSYFSNGLN